MRVALVAPPWLPVPPPAYGGLEAVLDTLARGLVTAGHDVMLVATGDSTCPVPTSWIHERAVGTGPTGPLAELRQVLHAYDLVATQGVDVVHDHTLIGPLYAARFAGLPVVTTNHGPFDGDLGPLYRVVAATTPVVAISHHQASTAGNTPTTVIHHGIDLDRFPVGTGGEHALFLGRMSPVKGVDRAIRIARRAGICLRIAAKMREPDEVAWFEQVVRPLLGGDVEYLGEVNAIEKMRLLAGAACLLNPIEWPEPFGMVMVESLACGTPVLVTPQGAAPEIVDDGVTGFVRASDAELARCVERVAGLDRRACRAAVEARFSGVRMVADHLALYKRAVANRSTQLVA
jgi:glycosyltransferase involved in cell wall biosynthesis